jgi:putative endonuclease
MRQKLRKIFCRGSGKDHTGISLGSLGETIAMEHLKEQGYRILERNYRTPLGEADLVVKDGDAVVFVEVKTRATLEFGRPFEAVTPQKQERLRRIALYYMKHHGIDGPVRFDVISIVIDHKRRDIEHIKAAF